MSSDPYLLDLALLDYVLWADLGTRRLTTRRAYALRTGRAG
jgi:hypothetical protein